MSPGKHIAIDNEVGTVGLNACNRILMERFTITLCHHSSFRRQNANASSTLLNHILKMAAGHRDITGFEHHTVQHVRECIGEEGRANGGRCVL